MIQEQFSREEYVRCFDIKRMTYMFPQSYVETAIVKKRIEGKVSCFKNDIERRRHVN